MRRLVRILVTRRGTYLSRDLLTEALWPDRPPADPAANLNVLVNRARRALGHRSLIVTGRGGYSFSTDHRCTVDAEEFVTVLKQAREHLAAGRSGAAVGRFRDALERWHGEPVSEDAYEDWAQEYRRVLFRAQQDALEGGAEAAIAANDPKWAVALAEEAVAQEPVGEPASLLLMRAQVAVGDRAAALETFETYRGRLADELGVDPSEEALSLHTRILRGEPLGPLIRRPPTYVSVEELAFVGRDLELAAVLAAAGPPQAAAAIVAGRAGTGKSRLLAEAARRTPVPVIAARAFAPERNDPWALTRSLLRDALVLDTEAAAGLPDRAAAALADLVPELTKLRVAAVSLGPETRRALVLEGALRIIEVVARDAALLLVDDIQWADPSSLALVALAQRRVAGLGTVVAYRPEEVAREGAVTSFLADLSAAEEVTTVSLGPLPEQAIGALIDDPELARAIIEHTDQTPFAVAEVVRALAAEGVIEQDHPYGWRVRANRAPQRAAEIALLGQRRSIVARLDRQPRRAREIIELLALMRRETPARTLAQAADADGKDVLADLDTLAKGGLVRVGSHGWAMAHELIAETIRDHLDRSQRTRLHCLIAQALQEEGADPAEVAHHLARCGDAKAATVTFGQAARGALDRFAREEAVGLAEAGLLLDPDLAVRSDLLEIRASARGLAGDLRGARVDFRAALSGRDHGPPRARILCRMAMLSSGAEDLVRASQLSDLALAEAQNDPKARAEALAVAAIVDMNLDRPNRAQERSEEALALFERIGDSAGLAGILDGRAMATFLGGKIRAAVGDFDRVARLFKDSGDLLRVVTPRSTRGHALVFMAAPEAGLRDAEEALELARTLGHPEGQAYALWHSSEALSALGRVGEAVAAAREALAMAERIGHRGWTATSLRALGIALQASGDIEGAEAAFRRSLEKSENLSLFAAWASARLALVLIHTGRSDEVEPFVTRALEQGPALGRYEARLAQAELAAARADPDASTIAEQALALASAGGHLESRDRLSQLARGATAP